MSENEVSTKLRDIIEEDFIPNEWSAEKFAMQPFAQTLASIATDQGRWDGQRLYWSSSTLSCTISFDLVDYATSENKTPDGGSYTFYKSDGLIGSIDISSNYPAFYKTYIADYLCTDGGLSNIFLGASTPASKDDTFHFVLRPEYNVEKSLIPSKIWCDIYPTADFTVSTSSTSQKVGTYFQLFLANVSDKSVLTNAKSTYTFDDRVHYYLANDVTYEEETKDAWPDIYDNWTQDVPHLTDEKNQLWVLTAVEQGDTSKQKANVVFESEEPFTINVYSVENENADIPWNGELYCTHDRSANKFEVWDGHLITSDYCSERGKFRIIMYGENNTYLAGSADSYSELEDYSNRWVIKSLGSSKVKALGDIASLMESSMVENDEEFKSSYLSDFCFRGLFYKCTDLERGPDISKFKKLPPFACYAMYYGCTSLKYAPIISALTIGLLSCAYMFYGCTSLKEISVTAIQKGTMSGTVCSKRAEDAALAIGSFAYMYYGCKSITVSSTKSTTCCNSIITYSSSAGNTTYNGVSVGDATGIYSSVDEMFTNTNGNPTITYSIGGAIYTANDLIPCDKEISERPTYYDALTLMGPYHALSMSNVYSPTVTERKYITGNYGTSVGSSSDTLSGSKLTVKTPATTASGWSTTMTAPTISKPDVWSYITLSGVDENSKTVTATSEVYKEASYYTKGNCPNFAAQY